MTNGEHGAATFAVTTGIEFISKNKNPYNFSHGLLYKLDTLYTFYCISRSLIPTFETTFLPPSLM